MTVFMFPGQGSQKKGMGKDLFSKYPDLVKKADDILGYSIESLCLENPDESLGNTQFTQPALYIVCALSYLAINDENEEKPEFLIGHSVGEYAALFAAGVFDFETGLTLVKKRGELMNQAKNGKMAAVIGITRDQIEKILQENSLDNLTIANYNSQLQSVLAGPEDDIKKAQETFKKNGAKLYVPLNVSGAFHSSFMAEAQKEFESFIKSFSFNNLNIPVIANVDAKPYQNDGIITNLTRQLTHPVLWTDIVQYLMNEGEVNFREIGPGKVLTGLIKNIKKTL